MCGRADRVYRADSGWCLGPGDARLGPVAGYLWYARATFGMGQSAVYSTLSRMAQSWFPARFARRCKESRESLPAGWAGCAPICCLGRCCLVCVDSIGGRRLLRLRRLGYCSPCCLRVCFGFAPRIIRWRTRRNQLARRSNAGQVPSSGKDDAVATAWPRSAPERLPT